MVRITKISFLLIVERAWRDVIEPQRVVREGSKVFAFLAVQQSAQITQSAFQRLVNSLLAFQILHLHHLG